MSIPNTEELVRAGRRAYFKMKREYDRGRPDAEPSECWAEAERLYNALSDFDHIYPKKPWEM